MGIYHTQCISPISKTVANRKVFKNPYNTPEFTSKDCNNIKALT
jgi:hypothetical protein